MNVISLRKNPESLLEMTNYLQEKWADETTKALFSDCLKHTLNATSSLPQWYLLKDQEKIVGCVGLIPNDFISRMDLYPWLCSLYIEESYRGCNLSELLIQQVKSDARKLGFEYLYLCTDHVGFYEKQGFEYVDDGYQLSGESIRIYQYNLIEKQLN